MDAPTGQLLEGVKVSVVGAGAAAGQRRDREAFTDAYGRFAIRLPEGDWEVRVLTPDEKFARTIRITVSGGQIATFDGRPLPRLIMYR